MARPLFTIGYEGRALDEFLAILAANKIERVVDIRELPLSRRRGFSKTPLAIALAERGIEYVHVRAAGNPYRRLKEDIPREELLAKYAVHLRTAREPVDATARAIDGQRAVLLCYEADPATCHRSLLAPRVARRLKLAIHNL